MPLDIVDVRPVRLRLVIGLTLVTPLGFATKFWLPHWLPGPFGTWCLLYGAAVLYEVFWVFVIAFVFPRLATWRVAGIVLIATCVLECLQLVHVAWLDAIRATFLGAALLGNGFDVWDFSHYLIGSALGGVLLAALRTQRR